MPITVEDFSKFAPQAVAPKAIVAGLAPHMERREITTKRRIRHFLAHLSVESQGFTRLEENLNYSAQRLTQVWPKRFPNVAAAQPYARNPRALANKVYNGRYGNTGPNDGWLYRGGGWIQLTFLGNYRAASEWTGLDLVAHPELARTVENAGKIACDFWHREGLNAIVDEDADEIAVRKWADLMSNEEDDLRQGTREINGGQNGLDHRRLALRSAAAIW